MAKWYCLIDGQQMGPIEAVELKRLAASGSLEPRHKVRKEEMAEWYPASQVKGLFVTRESEPASPAKLSKRRPAWARQVHFIAIAAVCALVAVIWIAKQRSSVTPTEPTRDVTMESKSIVQSPGVSIEPAPTLKKLAPEQIAQPPVKAHRDLGSIVGMDVVKPFDHAAIDEPPSREGKVSQPDYRPTLISILDGSTQIVSTQKIRLDGTSLYVTIAFLILDPKDSAAAGVNGMTGFVMVEGVGESWDSSSSKTITLTRQTQLTVARGNMPGFTFDSPKQERSEFVTKLTYTGFVPFNFLYYLRREGTISIEISGASFALDEIWAQHLGEVLDESLQQYSKRGYTAIHYSRPRTPPNDGDLKRFRSGADNTEMVERRRPFAVKHVQALMAALKQLEAEVSAYEKRHSKALSIRPSQQSREQQSVNQEYRELADTAWQAQHTYVSAQSALADWLTSEIFVAEECDDIIRVEQLRKELDAIQYH